MVVLTMAQSNTNNTNIADDVKSTIFHDFLGKGCASDSSPVEAKAGAGEARPQSETAPSASASVGASSSGGRRPISATSDLGSDAPKCWGEWPRRPQDEKTFFGMHPVRPTSASLVLQPAISGRADVNASKWEQAIPISVGPVLQYPPRVDQVVPFGYQGSSNRFKGANAGPSIISQAADEGSRTGIKGFGILSSINARSGTADKNMPSDGKQKSGIHISEPEPSTSQSRQGVTSASRQMTIFYGGQAHVFDEVHPNKADVIMALAGSNGGSWSTNYTPKSLTGNFSHGFCSVDRISMPPGFHQGSIVVKEARGPNQVAELSAEKKRVV